MAIIHSLKCTMPFSFVVPLLSLALTHCHLLSCVFTRCITRCHSLPLVVPLVVIRCHSYQSLSLSLSLIAICCNSLSFVVTRCTTCSCHSLSFVVTHCTTCSCHSLSFVVTRCHSIYHSSVCL